MKKKALIYLPIAIIALLVLISLQLNSCSSSRMPKQYPTDTIYSNTEGNGFGLLLSFARGPEHNHPLMAVWITDTTGNYIETLYIAESIANGYFDHADKSTGKWLEGAIRRPAALPVWAHKRNVVENDGLYIPTPETPIPDAISGATPQNNFVLITKTSDKNNRVFDVYFEINQTWDWNEYWTNNKFPGDAEYKTSCQPALVYNARVDTGKLNSEIPLKLIGRSHYNGADGKIYSDLETITTALQITSSISIKVFDGD